MNRTPWRAIYLCLALAPAALPAAEPISDSTAASTPNSVVAPAPAVQAAPLKHLSVARSDVQSFIDSMVRRHRFDRAALTTLLSEVQLQPRIVETIQRPAERSLLWWEYRRRFLSDERINQGVALWQAHRDTLDRIAAQTGVPAEYLVAITGVETFYGRLTGRYRVLDALATLGFEYPRRAEFFRKELEQFLLMAREEKIDVLQPLGSYAGAMGVPQFMPSSYRRYAVDGNGDGRRNLWEHGPDVFASIANYFREHGWRTGQPVIIETQHTAAPDLPANFKLTFADTLGSIRQRGYAFQTTMPDSTRAMLIPAALEQSTSWRLGLQNFYVITRYNRSSSYAMTVHDLASAIAERYRASLTAPVAQ
jgi:membrane-bound lytic murein transglycosylase B